MKPEDKPTKKLSPAPDKEQTIVIDPEIQQMLHPLPANELNLLEQSIIAAGCRDPLVVWAEKGILLDGHHRYQICQKHHLPFSVVELTFPDAEAAQAWVIRNQMARRNLSAWHKAALAWRFKPILAQQARDRKHHKGKTNDEDTGLLVQKSGEANTHRTVDQELAALTGLSHDTIHKVGFILKHAANHKALIAQLDDADISIHQAYESLRESVDSGAKSSTTNVDHSEQGEDISPAQNTRNLGQPSKQQPKPVALPHSTKGKTELKSKTATAIKLASPVSGTESSSAVKQYKAIKDLRNHKLTNIEFILECVVHLVQADDNQDNDRVKSLINDLRVVISKRW